MLKIRLQRVGKKHDPAFRMVVTEHTAGPKAGNAIEVLGSYDARKGKLPIVINAERVLYWMSRGAKPSDTVHNLLVSRGVIEGTKRDVLPRKKIGDMENTRAEVRAAKEVEAKAAEVAATEKAAKEAAAQEITKETTPAADTKAVAEESAANAATETIPEEPSENEAPSS